MPAGVSRLPPPARGRQVHGSFPLNSTPLPIIHTVHRKPSTFQTTASFPHDANTIFDLYISLSDHPMNSFHTTTHQNSTPRRSGNCYWEIRVKFLEIIISSKIQRVFWTSAMWWRCLPGKTRFDDVCWARRTFGSRGRWLTGELTCVPRRTSAGTCWPRRRRRRGPRKEIRPA